MTMAVFESFLYKAAIIGHFYQNTGKIYKGTISN